ncbi:MAG: hypothetical protein WDW36_007854 [Sanguina aurantia]
MPLGAGMIQQRLGSAAAKEQLRTVHADMPSTDGPPAIETEWAVNAPDPPTNCSARSPSTQGLIRALLEGVPPHATAAQHLQQHSAHSSFPKHHSRDPTALPNAGIPNTGIPFDLPLRTSRNSAHPSPSTPSLPYDVYYHSTLSMPAHDQPHSPEVGRHATALAGRVNGSCANACVTVEGGREISTAMHATHPHRRATSANAAADAISHGSPPKQLAVVSANAPTVAEASRALPRSLHSAAQRSATTSPATLTSSSAMRLYTPPPTSQPHKDRSGSTVPSMAAAVDLLAVRAEANKALTRHWQRRHIGVAGGGGGRRSARSGQSTVGGGAALRGVTPTSLADWSILMEQQQAQMVMQIEEVTTLLKLPSYEPRPTRRSSNNGGIGTGSGSRGNGSRALTSAPTTLHYQTDILPILMMGGAFSAEALLLHDGPSHNEPSPPPHNTNHADTYTTTNSNNNNSSSSSSSMGSILDSAPLDTPSSPQQQQSRSPRHHTLVSPRVVNVGARDLPPYQSHTAGGRPCSVAKDGAGSGSSAWSAKKGAPHGNGMAGHAEAMVVGRTAPAAPPAAHSSQSSSSMGSRAGTPEAWALSVLTGSLPGPAAMAAAVSAALSRGTYIGAFNDTTAMNAAGLSCDGSHRPLASAEPATRLERHTGTEHHLSEGATAVSRLPDVPDRSSSGTAPPLWSHSRRQTASPRTVPPLHPSVTSNDAPSCMSAAIADSGSRRRPSSSGDRADPGSVSVSSRVGMVRDEEDRDEAMSPRSRLDRMAYPRRESPPRGQDDVAPCDEESGESGLPLGADGQQHLPFHSHPCVEGPSSPTIPAAGHLLPPIAHRSTGQHPTIATIYETPSATPSPADAAAAAAQGASRAAVLAHETTTKALPLLPGFSEDDESSAASGQSGQQGAVAGEATATTSEQQGQQLHQAQQVPSVTTERHRRHSHPPSYGVWLSVMLVVGVAAVGFVVVPVSVAVPPTGRLAIVQVKFGSSGSLTMTLVSGTVPVLVALKTQSTSAHAGSARGADGHAQSPATGAGVYVPASTTFSHVTATVEGVGRAHVQDIFE